MEHDKYVNTVRPTLRHPFDYGTARVAPRFFSFFLSGLWGRHPYYIIGFEKIEEKKNAVTCRLRYPITARFYVMPRLTTSILHFCTIDRGQDTASRSKRVFWIFFFLVRRGTPFLCNLVFLSQPANGDHTI